ncbi:MAG TPA: hypothetical protein VFV88_13560 [Steroidobacteraceae bacterium]|jgi:hypothetical protein|nr:hypothetical protein [Steroidobacteraceae bacterium]
MKPAGILALALLAACADTSSISSTVSSANKQMEAKGSPFRYVARDSTSMQLTLMPLPAGPSKAVPELAQQVMDSIGKEEAKAGRGSALLEEVRHLQDGREVWVLQSLSGGVAYVIAFANPVQAGTDIRITGPTTYAK